MPPAKPRKRPCSTCPYRRDVPSAIWAQAEYNLLRTWDGEPADQALAGAFGHLKCHGTPALVCAGWAGHRDPQDLLAARLGVSEGTLDPSVLRYTTTVPLFASGAEAAEHGMADYKDPSWPARLAVTRIRRKRKDIR